MSKSRLVILLCPLFLTACVYYPKQIKVYDEQCQIQHKKLVLERSKNIRLGECSDDACIASLLSIPFQALVAGTLVVAGNVVYWFEKQGDCKEQPEKQD